MGRSLLAPGFRFKPTDVELLKYYLKRKLMGRRLHVNVIAEIDIYKYDPWDLPGKSCWESGDLKWYFFCPREKKYQTGNRMKRATEGGFWKVTGKDRSVLFSGEVAGWIKTLVFHTGRAPQGGRTDWVMHEYRLEDQGLADEGVPLDSYVLCIIFQKEGPGPRIGAQYGVPFKEEEWSDDDVEMSCDTVQEANIPQPDLGVMGNFDRQIATNTRSHEEVGRGSRVSALLSPSAVQDAYITQPDLGEMCNFDSRIATNTHSHEDVGIGPSSSCISNLLSPPCKVLQPVSGNYVTAQNHDSNGDDILSMLDCFTEENIFLMNGNGKRSTVEICSQGTPNAIMPESDDVLPNSYEDSYFPDRLGITPYESCTSDAVSPRCHVLPLEASNSLSSEMPLASHGDNILPMFDSSIGESSLYMSQSENNEVAACLEAIPNANMPDPDLILPDPDLVLNSNNAASTLFPGPSFETFRYGDACGVLQEVSYNYGTMEKTRPDANLPVINSFAEANTFPSIDNDENEYRDRSNHLGNADATPLANTRSIYEDLGDLGCLTSEDGYDFSSFLELGDLD